MTMCMIYINHLVNLVQGLDQKTRMAYQGSSPQLNMNWKTTIEKCTLIERQKIRKSCKNKNTN